MMFLPVVTQKAARRESAAHLCGKASGDDVHKIGLDRFSECSAADGTNAAAKNQDFGISGRQLVKEAT
jgi:hypothetical protein